MKKFPIKITYVTGMIPTMYKFGTPIPKYEDSGHIVVTQSKYVSTCMCGEIVHNYKIVDIVNQQQLNSNVVSGKVCPLCLNIYNRIGVKNDSTRQIKVEPN